MTTVQVLTVLAAVGSGVLAGIYAAFSVAVMPGLNRVPPESGMQAMQAINERIQNPLFLLVFMGTPLVAIAVAVLGVIRRGDASSAWGWGMLVAGCVLLVVGSLIVTMVANVPRNDALAALDPAAPGSAAAWASYLQDWTRWNHVRGVLSVFATACFVVAALAA